MKHYKLSTIVSPDLPIEKADDLMRQVLVDIDNVKLHYLGLQKLAYNIQSYTNGHRYTATISTKCGMGANDILTKRLQQHKNIIRYMAIKLHNNTEDTQYNPKSPKSAHDFMLETNWSNYLTDQGKINIQKTMSKPLKRQIAKAIKSSRYMALNYYVKPRESFTANTHVKSS